MARTLTPTSTLSYHTTTGFVHIIPRPTLSLGKVVDGKLVNLLTNCGSDKPKYFCEYLVLFQPARQADAVYVVLGCGSILKLDYDAFQYMDGEGGRCQVDFDRCELVQELPTKVDAPGHDLPAFIF